MLEVVKETNEKSKDMKMEMKLVAPPYYEITTVTTSKSNGITLLNQVLKLVEEKAKISQDF